MKNENYTTVISVTGTFTILFLFGFSFNLTKSPMLLLLMGMASFGYMLFLLGFGHTTKNLRTICYMFFGLILIMLSLISVFNMPHAFQIFI